MDGQPRVVELRRSWSRMAAGLDLGPCGPMRATTLGRGGSSRSPVSGEQRGCGCRGGRPAWRASSPEPMLVVVEAGGGRRPSKSASFLSDGAQAGGSSSSHVPKSAVFSSIRVTGKDQGESSARRHPMRTTATPAGAVSFQEAWSWS